MSTSTQKHVLAGKRIIVAGAGIAGLAFTRALYLAWPSSHPRPEIVLYERSTKEQDVSREGYTMGIKGFGLDALKDLGLFDLAVENSTTSSDPTFFARDWSTMLELAPRKVEKGGKPLRGYRLVRHVLRDMLLAALPESQTVNWECGCESARILDTGRVEVSLGNGTVDTCDLLIAADGASSKIRTALLPDAKLEFAGAVCYIATSRFPNGKPELLREKWGMNISGMGIPFLTFPIDDHSGVWALSYRAKEPVRRVRGEEAVARKDELLNDVKRLGKCFGEPFGEFVDASDPETLQLFNAMQRYPIIHSKELPNANVVLIGDANHAMTPYSGNGANTAMKDAVELAKRLANSGTSVRAAIDEYDVEAEPRSRKAIDRSWYNIRLLHSSGPGFWLLRVIFALVSLVFGAKK